MGPISNAMLRRYKGWRARNVPVTGRPVISKQKSVTHTTHDYIPPPITVRDENHIDRLLVRLRKVHGEPRYDLYPGAR